MAGKQAAITTFLLVLILSLTSACGGGGGGATATTPPGKTSGDAAAGKAVFDQNCNGCHPGGAQGTGPALKGKNLSADRIKTQVRQGGGGMPAFSASQISDEQLNNLVQYVQSLG